MWEEFQVDSFLGAGMFGKIHRGGGLQGWVIFRLDFFFYWKGLGVDMDFDG